MTCPACGGESWFETDGRVMFYRCLVCLRTRNEALVWAWLVGQNTASGAPIRQTSSRDTLEVAFRETGVSV